MTKSQVEHWFSHANHPLLSVVHAPAVCCRSKATHLSRVNPKPEDQWQILATQHFETNIWKIWWNWCTEPNSGKDLKKEECERRKKLKAAPAEQACVAQLATRNMIAITMFRITAVTRILMSQKRNPNNRGASGLACQVKRILVLAHLLMAGCTYLRKRSETRAATHTIRILTAYKIISTLGNETSTSRGYCQS